MLIVDSYAHKNIKFLHHCSFVFIILNVLIPLTLSAQNSDSLAASSVDSVKSFIWQPKILPELSQFDPSNVSNTLQLVVPKANKSLKYYDPKNVMPKNFWEMDYRGTSYYTPRIVSDRLAQMMHRPSPDSFLPLPTIAILAARMALKYADIQFKIEIKSTDYIIDDNLEAILFSLLQKSPQTVKELYKSKEINQSRTMEMLEKELQTLIDKKIVKKRKMETEPDKYFAAQDLETAIHLIKNELESENATMEQKQQLSSLARKLSELKENND